MSAVRGGEMLVPPSSRQRLESYLDRLYGYAVAMAGDREQARELVQECAVRALTARRVPEEEGAFRAWLFRILRNLFLDSRRRQEVRERSPTAAPEDEAPIQPLRGDYHLINSLTVRRGLRGLSEPHREILNLIDVAGFSYGEAAELLGVPPGTVMSRLSRARAALLTAISDDQLAPDNVVPIRRRSERH